MVQSQLKLSFFCVGVSAPGAAFTGTRLSPWRVQISIKPEAPGSHALESAEAAAAEIPAIAAWRSMATRAMLRPVWRIQDIGQVYHQRVFPANTPNRGVLVVQDLAEEFLRPLVLRIGEEGFRLVLLDDLAAIHEDHPVGDRAREAHFVGHAHHGHAFFGE